MNSSSENPVLAPWTGPWGGVPAFDRIQVAHFKPALEDGMAAQLAEIDAITNDPAAPTFANTIVAFEKSGAPLTRALSLFGVWAGGLSTPDFQALETEMSPKLSAFRDSIIQNAKLFARIKAVYDAPRGALTAEQQRLLWRHYTAFTRQGAALDAAKKTELSALNQQLATLTTRFSQNQLGEEEEVLVIESREGLAGLPESQIEAAAAEATRRGKPGVWMISNTRSSMEPFLISSSDRSLRERGWRMWTHRGDNGNARDNNAIAAEILLLRARKAKLLGFPTFAHWRLDDAMAKDPQTALDLMLSVWTPARDQFRRDVVEIEKLAGFKVEPWDYRAYAEKLRKAKYDLDLNELKPYLQLEKLREAMFWVAGQLYGLRFEKRDGLPVFHPDVTVYEVWRGEKPVGLWYFDPYARPAKQSGAWMSAYRDQQRIEGEVLTLVSNNSNFIKGQPISWDDARTMFHEFGHALHGLNSNVTYPSLSGTNTTRDFVEFPSQLNEHWLSTPEVLKFLVNEKGEPIPASLVERLEKARTFNEGFATAEAQASAIVDMKLHLAGETPIDPKKFEVAILAEIGMPPQLVMRHRIPAFAHIFSGDGYAAGYYSYIWAEVLERDAYEAFLEAGGPYDRTVANRLYEAVMSVGDTVDPAEAFRAFRGRDPKPDALLRAKGFAL
ncbi:MAG: M3 family metallopeptidase [Archangium sp.]|nr:M3 family metallopeptidase [Archangium sp.]